MGRRWCDIDLDLAFLSVVQTLHMVSGKGYMIRQPKTAKGRRLVSLSPSLSLLLRQYRAEQETQRLLLEKRLTENDLVFSHPDGSPLNPSTITHAFNKVIRESKIPHIRFHDLRHTHATLMLKAGVHPKVVSERLGHANIGITLDTYSHVLPGLQEAAAERFDEMLKHHIPEIEDVGKMLANPHDSGTRLEGFEPTTPGSEDRCSCPLSYRRKQLP